MDDRPEQPPEGKLIAEALTRSGLSIRKASKLAGISYGRWRQIASGVQNVSPGSYGRVTAPAGTLARMAAVVKVTPEQLESSGRPDAARELREILRRDDEPDAALDLIRQTWGDADYAPGFIQGIWHSDMWTPGQKLSLIRSYIDSQQNPGNPGAEREPRSA